MKDSQGKNLWSGNKVVISKAAIIRYKLMVNRGIVHNADYNTEQLVSVSTDHGLYDFHAKSLTIVQ